MKKIGLICATLLISLSLAGCNNLASQQHKASSSSSSTKMVKHHKTHKKINKKKQNSSSSATSNSSSQNGNGNIQQTNGQTSSSAKQVDKSDPSTWDNIPYKGYPSYNEYCEANGGDPEVQAETARMQHDENVKKGIENPDGSETENFKNWVRARDWQEQQGNNNYPDYDQNQDWNTGLTDQDIYGQQ